MQIGNCNTIELFTPILNKALYSEQDALRVTRHTIIPTNNIVKVAKAEIQRYGIDITRGRSFTSLIFKVLFFNAFEPVMGVIKKCIQIQFKKRKCPIARQKACDIIVQKIAQQLLIETDEMLCFKNFTCKLARRCYKSFPEQGDVVTHIFFLWGVASPIADIYEKKQQKLSDRRKYSINSSMNLLLKMMKSFFAGAPTLWPRYGHDLYDPIRQELGTTPPDYYRY